METLTLGLIVALVVGGFLIFQDYYEIPPMGFSFSSQFYIGIGLVIGTVGVFGAMSIRKKRIKNSNL